MKNLFPTLFNKLPTASIGSSLLITILFCIHLFTQTSQQTILRITEIISEILSGILEGIGAFNQTIAPNEELSSKIAQEIAEARNLRESEILKNWREDLRQENIENDNKFIIIVILFGILMLYPYLSDSTINTSILPFLVVFKQRLQLIKLTEEFKDRLTFLFYLSVVIFMIILQINSIPDYTGSESVWLSVSLYVKLKEVISRSSTPTSSTFSSSTEGTLPRGVREALDKEYFNPGSAQVTGGRSSTVTEIDYPGSVIDIRRGSEWDVQSVESDSGNLYNYCSTCPSVGSGLASDPVSPTTRSMIKSIAREKVSSVSFDNSSIIQSDSEAEFSTLNVSTSSLTTSSYGSVIPNTGRDTFGGTIAESTAGSTVESESSREFDLAFLSYREALRAQAELRLQTPDPLSESIGFRQWCKENPELVANMRSQYDSPFSHSSSDSDASGELFIPFLFILTNSALYKKIANSKLLIRISNSKPIQNAINSDIFIYCKSSLLIKTILTIMLSLLLKNIIISSFNVLLLPLWAELLQAVSHLGNTTSDSLVIIVYILIPTLYLFRSNIAHIIINSKIKKLFVIILQLCTVMFIDMNTFNLLTPNSVFLDSSTSSSSNTPNFCNRILNFFGNIFKHKFTYIPLAGTGATNEEDNFNAQSDRGINPYSTLPAIKGNSSTLETARQQAKAKRIEDDQWNKGQSMWFDSESEPLMSDSEQSTSSIYGILRRSSTSASSVTKRVTSWLEKNNKQPNSSSKSEDLNDSTWIE